MKLLISLVLLQAATMHGFPSAGPVSRLHRRPSLLPRPAFLPPIEDTTGLVDPQLSSEATIAVFVAGLVPFAVATVEFWRRIAVGDSFGTGTDSVVIIGEDDNPQSSRGRRVLGKGALVVAYILFGVSALVLGIVGFAVLSSGELPETL